MDTEHTRDWSILLPPERPTGQIDQAWDLPEIACFTLYQFPCFLKRPCDYGTWRNEIYNILKIHQIHRLIDYRISRPFKDSPNARRWQQMSLEIRKWIAWNMDPILVRMIVKAHPQADLADEFMMGADRILERFTRSPPQDFEDITHGLFNLIGCQRREYSSARWFVHRIMEYYTHTLNMKMGIPPYVPLMILLAEIKDDVGSAFVDVRIERLKSMNNPAQDVTRQYFEEIYLEVLEYLDEDHDNDVD
ncbi:uncharacterized protein N7479_009659 [Penicillium vulpinum]|uniref:Uncharacterized protein n=1 Tax=Penicillium vulpinum TaxID=29845 RepID=A0A1V6RG09_9EURO|nr:uncharacterized protein N7479_009659 [Penicillium vulpinum]KAJ5951246.1 hypothetical protein N7479_009659 [Penicillium vulpinum]OQE00438.1 hypothetical protein PENVUL_c052G00690 [Penicillium vulpinum]